MRNIGGNSSGTKIIYENGARKARTRGPTVILIGTTTVRIPIREIDDCPTLQTRSPSKVRIIVGTERIGIARVKTTPEKSARRRRSGAKDNPQTTPRVAVYGYRRSPQS